MIPIDSCTSENGCTEVFSGYHEDFLSKDATTYMLPDEVVDVSRRTFLSLKPGDISIFHGLTPHRSEPNKSDQMRRVFYVSYNAMSDGGEQHDHHYQKFHQYMRERMQTENSLPYYFK
jgi:ectoine hydroxylase-related dioxygenase (phytanoyl-CoA dioxygenase family)